ncbi:hypothetical protein COCMIDRAFT_28836 [Bipolaris oryzae ATCC 44560]|uniref:Uncharacterized protein n=1 Tax=Bipolaris oryzae ATCC 44560 TaxID=930090 RepID=W6Z4L7_COCMI|nr:uncharacterized protein COCMIDRAFT_28836 [Bipolaris oryzae ATCC 44560]EUC42554.1 hypothetical protein COCMIDRAFT_28836 [Bipolaris oryzae ATCC 44560]
MTRNWEFRSPKDQGHRRLLLSRHDAPATPPTKRMPTPYPSCSTYICAHLYIHLSPTSGAAGVADLVNAVVVVFVISAGDATLWIYLLREVPLADATKAILIGEEYNARLAKTGTRGRPRQRTAACFVACLVRPTNAGHRFEMLFDDWQRDCDCIQQVLVPYRKG